MYVALSPLDHGHTYHTTIVVGHCMKEGIDKIKATGWFTVEEVHRRHLTIICTDFRYETVCMVLSTGRMLVNRLDST